MELLAELKERYRLHYKIMINSEPHQRKDFSQGIFSEGSVGKIMPFLYVRGYLSHIGKVFEGFNPLNLMSEIVRRTELNMDFSDVVGRESAPPPTWLYLKDSKKQYDVSMPLSASGCFSILTLDQSPAEVMEKVNGICEASFDKDSSADRQPKLTGRFSEVTEPVAKEAAVENQGGGVSARFTGKLSTAHGQRFREAEYEENLAYLSQQLKDGSINIIESNFALVEFVFDYIDDLAPRVVYGLIPPYYPNVSNLYFDHLAPESRLYRNRLDEYAQETYGQHYTKEYFYTGISDLSYTSIKNGAKTLDSLEIAMPLFGAFYRIPVEAIEKIAMPCMNIGPWGKDFHKLTERVCKEDLYERTPRIINKAVSLLLENPLLTE